MPSTPTLIKYPNEIIQKLRLMLIFSDSKSLWSVGSDDRFVNSDIAGIRLVFFLTARGSL